MLPIILGVAGAGLGALGFAKGVEGVSNINKAKERGERAEEHYRKAVERLEHQFQETGRVAELYGKLQLRARQRVVRRFANFIRRTGQKSPIGDMDVLAGLGISIQQVQEFEALALEADKATQGMLGAAGAGFVGTVALANTAGTVAVPQLFGLFARQVAVSELGLSGAAVWLGGGNALLGGVLLGGVTLSPALAVMGFQFASRGEKALTEVQKYEMEVRISIENMRTQQEFLTRVEKQIRESGILVRKLESRASKCLDELEYLSFNPTRNAAKFQQAFLLVKALAELLKTPILNQDRTFNYAASTIIAKYQTIGDSY